MSAKTTPCGGESKGASTEKRAALLPPPSWAPAQLFQATRALPSKALHGQQWDLDSGQQRAYKWMQLDYAVQLKIIRDAKAISDTNDYSIDLPKFAEHIFNANSTDAKQSCANLQAVLFPTAVHMYGGQSVPAYRLAGVVPFAAYALLSHQMQGIAQHVGTIAQLVDPAGQAQNMADAAARIADFEKHLAPTMNNSAARVAEVEKQVASAAEITSAAQPVLAALERMEASLAAQNTRLAALEARPQGGGCCVIS